MDLYHSVLISLMCVMFSHLILVSNFFDFTEPFRENLRILKASSNKLCSDGEQCTLYPKRAGLDKCFDLASEEEAISPKLPEPGPSRMVVVMPFAIYQFLFVKTNLWSWKSDLFPPCFRPSGVWMYAGLVDLVFYTNRELTDVEKNQILIWIDESNSRLCFSSIMFRFFQAQPGRDSYGEGTVDMFYYMWGDQRKDFYDPNSASVMLFMEPDTRPIVPNWLEAVYNKSLYFGDFWVVSSFKLFGVLVLTIMFVKNKHYDISVEVLFFYFVVYVLFYYT